MMLDLTRLATWLRCPVCEADLDPVDRLALGCSSGHRHDVNKRGFVSLLPPRSTVVGDTAAMLDARDAVLEGGAFSPIADAVAAAVAGVAAPPGDRIVDSGAGTGYYLRAALADRPSAHGLALDLSPAAVSRAVRSSDRIDGLVADTWQPLPLRSATADAILDIFAPRNLPEFHRVLRPAGSLLVVVPRPEHLESLRAAGTMLTIPSDKADDLIALAEPQFRLQTREPVSYELPLDSALRSALAEMGPSARHANAAAADTPSTRISVDVLHFRRL